MLSDRLTTEILKDTTHFKTSVTVNTLYIWSTAARYPLVLILALFRILAGYTLVSNTRNLLYSFFSREFLPYFHTEMSESHIIDFRRKKNYFVCQGEQSFAHWWGWRTESWKMRGRGDILAPLPECSIVSFVSLRLLLSDHSFPLTPSI